MLLQKQRLRRDLVVLRSLMVLVMYFNVCEEGGDSTFTQPDGEIVVIILRLYKVFIKLESFPEGRFHRSTEEEHRWAFNSTVDHRLGTVLIERKDVSEHSIRISRSEEHTSEL